MAKYKDSENKLIRFIVVTALCRVWKQPQQAFTELDFKGKGYVEASDLVTHPVAFQFPLSK